MPHNPFHAVNLVATQTGYVPLRDRFKSFPVDRLFGSDAEVFFINKIGGYEHRTLDMILKVPAFVRLEVQNRNRKPSIGNCLVTAGTGEIILADGKCIEMNPGECLTVNGELLLTDEGKCLQLVPGLMGEFLIDNEGSLITANGNLLDIGGN